MSDRYVPLSVREGTRLRRLAWWLGLPYDVVRRVP
jgi:hypothetical protein